MSKHTPGPWNWQRPISRNLANCLSGGGRPLLRCIDVSDADAALIAEAPALADALRWALEQIEDSLDPDHQAALAEAQATLNRATGE